jgi:hypothetical protein
LNSFIEKFEEDPIKIGWFIHVPVVRSGACGGWVAAMNLNRKQDLQDSLAQKTMSSSKGNKYNFLKLRENNFGFFLIILFNKKKCLSHKS